MATVNLLPNTDVSNDWTLSTGSDVYALIDDDHTGNISGDSSFISALAAGKSCIVQLQDFTEAHSSIDGVQVVVKAGNDGRGQTYEIGTKLLPAIGGAYYSEGTGTELSNRNYLTHTFTNRTTYDGSNAWDNSRVNALKLGVSLDAHSGGLTKFTYAYVIVTYTEPLAVDNSIFFGANF